MSVLQIEITTPVGPIYLVASNVGLKGILWRPLSVRVTKEFDLSDIRSGILQKAELQLCEYFRGERSTFDLPLDPDGTEFQKRVWNELRGIPYGKTLSYKDIALALGDAKACRAVGTANGRNPLSIVVPCHRVIGSSGTLTGYAGGLEIKAKLLNIEKAKFSK